MSVIEDLLLRLQTHGFREGTAEVDATAAAVGRTGKEAEKADAKTVGLGKSFGGLAAQAKGAAGMLGVGALAFGLSDAVRHGQHLQEVQAQLGASLHANVRSPAKDATDQMTEFADSLSTRGGFTPTEAIQAMAQFLRVTKDVHKAESDATLAANISRGAHVDYGRAIRAVTLLEQGRTQGLSRLGIVVPKITTATDNLHATVKHATAEQLAAAKATDALATKQSGMARVTQQYSGALSAYSHTTAGGISNLRNSVEVLSTKLGTMLLPVVNAVVGVLVKMIGPLTQMLPLILGLAAAWGVYKLATTAAAVATALTETAMWGNVAAALALVPAITGVGDAWAVASALFESTPIGVVITLVAALGVGLYLLITHVKAVRVAFAAAWGWIRHATVDTFHAVTKAVDAAIKWIGKHWPLIVGILAGPIGLAVEQIVTHMDTVKKLPTEILHAFTSVAGQIAKAIVWPFAWAFDWVKHHLPHFHTVHVGPVGIPLPSFQTGGPVRSTGPYLVGERGPEIVQLPRGGYVHPNSALGGAGDQAIVIYNILDGKLMSQSVIRQGLLQQSRGG